MRPAGRMTRLISASEVAGSVQKWIKPSENTLSNASPANGRSSLVLRWNSVLSDAIAYAWRSTAAATIVSDRSTPT
jgi:hypothetical protein